MVRNVASMQSLHTTLPHRSIQTGLDQQQLPTQSIDNQSLWFREMLEVDSMAKVLRERIKSGTATLEKMGAYKERAKALLSIKQAEDARLYLANRAADLAPGELPHSIVHESSGSYGASHGPIVPTLDGQPPHIVGNSPETDSVTNAINDRVVGRTVAEEDPAEFYEGSTKTSNEQYYRATVPITAHQVDSTKQAPSVMPRTGSLVRKLQAMTDAEKARLEHLPRATIGRSNDAEVVSSPSSEHEIKVQSGVRSKALGRPPVPPKKFLSQTTNPLYSFRNTRCEGQAVADASGTNANQLRPSRSMRDTMVQMQEEARNHGHVVPHVPRSQNGQQISQPKGLAAALAAQDEALRFKRATKENAAKYTKPFCDFLTDNPTVFHAVDSIKRGLKEQGWTELSERETWDIKPWGHYFVERNGSSLIAFVVGADYKPGNGAAILAGHVDALTAKLKPISAVPNKAGYLQLGVAPYAGALNSTWWDRDLGIGGRVHIKKDDKIVTKLVKLDWPIARIPTLAPHFGEAAAGPFNKETNMVPIIGLDSSDSTNSTIETPSPFSEPPLLGGTKDGVSSFIKTQPPALVKVIGENLGLSTSEVGNIVNWELELFDVQPATVGGLNKEFIYAGRIDDKLCSWAAIQALKESQIYDTRHSSLIKVVGLFDDEEIGSLLRQGAKGNFLPITLERAVGALAGHTPTSDLMGKTYANSFMVSSDVTHAVNPNFLGAYLENHAPHLNVGIAVAADSNGHMTTDSVSTTILKRCADSVGAKLQVFQIRNDSRSGGTVGPMLSSALGIRAIDAGLPQLSMHSIRATTGALDPGLGVLMFTGFLNCFEAVDKEMRG